MSALSFQTHSETLILPAETLSPAIPTEIEQLAADVLELSDMLKCRIATAESCTGGLLASLLTDLEGLGHCFERGFVCYSDRAKRELLGVASEALISDGPVSKRTAIGMAEGALRHSGADVAAAITGFAGRGGPDDEAGLVHFAVARSGRTTIHKECHFGDLGRGKVRIDCLRTALQLISQQLRDSST